MDCARNYADTSGDLVHLFRGTVASHPDRVAVETSDAQLTYTALADRVHCVAAHLSRRLAAPGGIVGVEVQDRADFVTLALGILTAGAAYLPLDPTYPSARRQLMVEDAEPDLLVTDGDAPDGCDVVRARTLLDDEVRIAPAIASGLPRDRDLAYVMYTSGSTGRPKGVAVHHAAVASLVLDDPVLAGIGAGRVLQLAPTSFDASTLEIWLPLVHGGTLVCPGADTDAKGLATVVREAAPDVVWLTAGLFASLLDADPHALRGVGTVITGGDRVPGRAFAMARDSVRHGAVAGYGPTEATVFASVHVAVPGRDYNEVPVGRALAGRTLRVLTSQLEEAPLGEEGDLYIGGTGVALGYLRRPSLTAGRFVADPYSEEPGARMYRTGDRGCRLPDGEVEYLGRADRQVKVRGYRVELDEVESVVAEHPDVLAVVAATHGTGAERRLGIHVAVRPDSDLAAPGLRRWLADRVPSYLIPNNVRVSKRLPLDANGKLDRSTANAYRQRSAAGLPSAEAPANDLERLVVDVFRDVLGLDEVGADDSFFDLGGDSLAAMRMVEQLRTAGVTLTLRRLFRDPTPRLVAQAQVTAAARA